MSISTRYKDIVIDVPSDIYAQLNRASREYDMNVTDLYYFILNANSIDDIIFKNIFDETLKIYYKYSEKKDVISNDFVIPAIKNQYNIGDDKLITNHWTINFDGVQKCSIFDITVTDNKQEIIYTGPVDDDWNEKIGILNSKIRILDDLIAKLVTAVNDGSLQHVRDEYAKIRDMRIELAMQEDINRRLFLEQIVTPLLENEDPDKCTWNLNPITKTLTIVKTID